MSFFKPTYGQHFQVAPRHWWNPKERKAARLHARRLDLDWENGKEPTEGAAVGMVRGSFVRWPP